MTTKETNTLPLSPLRTQITPLIAKLREMPDEVAVCCEYRPRCSDDDPCIHCYAADGLRQALTAIDTLTAALQREEEQEDTGSCGDSAVPVDADRNAQTRKESL
jgi:hypothetical protein